MIRQRVIIVGDARTNAHARYEFLSTMLQRRFDVTVIDIAALATDETTFEQLVNLVSSSVVREDGADQLPALIGFGAGATVSLSVAAAHPDAIASLALIAGWLVAPPKMRAIVSLFERMTVSDSALGAEFFNTQLVSSLGWSASTQLPSELSVPVLRESAAVNLADSASSVSTPTLVIGCARDEFASLEQSQLLFGAIANARYTTITSGHDVMVERPAELLSILDQFIAEPEHFSAGAAIAEARP